MEINLVIPMQIALEYPSLLSLFFIYTYLGFFYATIGDYVLEPKYVSDRAISFIFIMYFWPFITALEFSDAIEGRDLL